MGVRRGGHSAILLPSLRACLPIGGTEAPGRGARRRGGAWEVGGLLERTPPPPLARLPRRGALTMPVSDRPPRPSPPRSRPAQGPQVGPGPQVPTGFTDSCGSAAQGRHLKAGRKPWRHPHLPTPPHPPPHPPLFSLRGTVGSTAPERCSLGPQKPGAVGMSEQVVSRGDFHCFFPLQGLD